MGFVVTRPRVLTAQPERSTWPRLGSSAGTQQDDLSLRETIHRCNNDLQLVVGLLALQLRRAASAETRLALSETMERVAILARARASLGQQRHPTLESALRQVCEALQSQADLLSIVISLEIATAASGLSPVQITPLALIVNELATNAIKHAFAADQGGRISIAVRQHDSCSVAVTVDDDGLPFPALADRRSGGLGLGLVPRLMESVGGLIILPTSRSKRYEMRVPVQPVG